MKTAENPLAVSVIKNDQITLDRLSYLSKHYYNSMTPHLGRKWRSDQAAAQLGVPLKNILSTQSCLDTIDRPEFCQFQDTLYRITENGVKSPLLVPYLEFSTNEIPSTFIQKLLQSFKKPMQLHYETARKVLGSDVQMYTYGKQEDAMMTLQKVLMQNGFSLFDRAVLPNGSVIKKSYNEAAHLINQHIDFTRELIQMVVEGKSSAPEGPLMRNTINIFCDIIVSLLEQQVSGTLENPAKTILMCGPSMISYMKERERFEEISAMYEITAEYFALPSQVQIMLIPLDNLETLCHTGEKNAVHLLKEILVFKKTVEEQNKQIAKALPAQRSALIEEKKKYAAHGKVLYNDYFNYLSQRKSFFHLDALESGERMATSPQVIPDVLSLTLFDLKKLGPPPTIKDQLL